MRYWSWVLVLCVVLPLLGKEKKLIGSVIERDLLLKSHTFCVDVSKLTPDEAKDMRKFLDAESRPKRLLSKIAWQLVPDCAQADAAARVTFTQGVGVAQSPPNSGTLQGTPMTTVPTTEFQATLQVLDRASSKLIYQAVSRSSNNGRTQALSEAFSALAKDLKNISE